MAKKDQLRLLRAGTIINASSKKQESEVMHALTLTIEHLQRKFSGIVLTHQAQWLLRDIVSSLRSTYPEVDFNYHFDTSALRPDGGILFLEPRQAESGVYPILIAEVKNQGTNDQRAIEGLPKQAKGNAIERLGKNVIGLRTALLQENIFPFVCFGYGCDFAADSSILDRVATIAMFGHLNRTYLFSDETGKFNRGSFYFREQPWLVTDMAEVMIDIAERSVQYYFSKYREDTFVPRGEP